LRRRREEQQRPLCLAIVHHSRPCDEFHLDLNRNSVDMYFVEGAGTLNSLKSAAQQHNASATSSLMVEKNNSDMSNSLLVNQYHMTSAFVA
jgi:hypothetical protein